MCFSDLELLITLNSPFHHMEISWQLDLNQGESDCSISLEMWSSEGARESWLSRAGSEEGDGLQK